MTWASKTSSSRRIRANIRDGNRKRRRVIAMVISESLRGSLIACIMGSEDVEAWSEWTVVVELVVDDGGRREQIRLDFMLEA